MAGSKFPKDQDFMNAVFRAFRTLEKTGNLHVIDKDLSSPDGSETEGDIFILASSPSGDWSSGSEGDLALWDGANWHIITPSIGYHAYVDDEDRFYVFKGATDLWEQPQASQKHAEDVSIPGGGGSVDVTHGFSTKDIVTEFWRKDADEVISPDWNFKSGDETNTIVVSWDFQLTMRAVILA